MSPKSAPAVARGGLPRSARRRLSCRQLSPTQDPTGMAAHRFDAAAQALMADFPVRGHPFAVKTVREHPKSPWRSIERYRRAVGHRRHAWHSDGPPSCTASAPRSRAAHKIRWLTERIADNLVREFGSACFFVDNYPGRVRSGSAVATGPRYRSESLVIAQRLCLSMTPFVVQHHFRLEKPAPSKPINAEHLSGNGP